jgi:hypothetical protein
MDADAIDAMPTYTRPFLVIGYPVFEGFGLADVKERVGTFVGSINGAFGKDVNSPHSIERRTTGIYLEAVRVVLSFERSVGNLGHDRASFQARELTRSNSMHISCHVPQKTLYEVPSPPKRHYMECSM